MEGKDQGKYSVISNMYYCLVSVSLTLHYMSNWKTRRHCGSIGAALFFKQQYQQQWQTATAPRTCRSGGPGVQHSAHLVIITYVMNHWIEREAESLVLGVQYTGADRSGHQKISNSGIISRSTPGCRHKWPQTEREDNSTSLVLGPYQRLETAKQPQCKGNDIPAVWETTTPTI